MKSLDQFSYIRQQGISCNISNFAVNLEATLKFKFVNFNNLLEYLIGITN